MTLHHRRANGKQMSSGKKQLSSAKKAKVATMLRRLELDPVNQLLLKDETVVNGDEET